MEKKIHNLSMAKTMIPHLRSCEEETSVPISGYIKGEVPRWLKGSLIRVGAGLLRVGPDKYNHVFDGLALLHRFRFESGCVTYQNRFLRSDAYRRNHAANRIVVSEFGTRGFPDPCKTTLQRFSSLFTMEDLTDNCLVNIVRYSDEVYSAGECNFLWRIDPVTLESLQKVNLNKFFPVFTATAHPHTDADGTVYNIGTSYGLRSAYKLLKFPMKRQKEDIPFQRGKVLCSIPASKSMNPSYYHSFAMTDDYFVFVEQPLYLNVLQFAKAHLISGTYAEGMHFDDRAKTRFHVISRERNELLKACYVSPCFFLFHHINAYEEEDHLVVDILCYDDAGILSSMYTDALAGRSESTAPLIAQARRYVLPLHVQDSGTKCTGKMLVTLSGSEAKAIRQHDGSILCQPEILTGSDPWMMELPRIHYERMNGKKYRYFYAIGETKNTHQSCLMKVDTLHKKVTSWGEPGTNASEPVFVANPEDKSEDEDAGVVLASLLYTDDERKVSTIILDARTMQELGRVDFVTSSSVPGDFHGLFLADT